MHSKTKKALVALAASVLLTGPAAADLTGDLKIFLDTSNPAPRATMEAMIGRFQDQHPGLNVETTVIDARLTRPRSATF